MKKLILVIDDDLDYSKKFCNQAIKLLGKKYTFLTFANTKSLKEYASENKVESIITTRNNLESLYELEFNSIYILNEIDKELSREGKKTYIYKLQNIKNILEVVDKDIEERYGQGCKLRAENQKLVLFYANGFIKNKLEIVKRISRYLLKKKKVLIVDLDEFENYKGNVGLSNIIFNYKENKINIENLTKEIITEKNQDFIKSVTYPEDFNVISNIDLANIVNEIMKLPYDYVFINADYSYLKSQYIFNDADIVILLKESGSEKLDKFKSYLKNENSIDFKKINEIDMAKVDKNYLVNFTKQVFKD